MGVIKQGILGAFSGKVAGVVGSSWKGIATMRSLPPSVANPKTAAQVGQRTKFSAIVEIASILLSSIVKPLWDRFAQRMSGYNHFVQQNIGAVDTSGVVTYADLKIAEGGLTGPENMNVTWTGIAGQFEVLWDDNSGTGSAQASDDAYIAAYSPALDEWVTSEGDSQRDGSPQTIQFSGSTGADPIVHFYLAFRKSDGTMVSNSVYGSSAEA